MGNFFKVQNICQNSKKNVILNIFKVKQQKLGRPINCCPVQSSDYLTAGWPEKKWAGFAGPQHRLRLSDTPETFINTKTLRNKKSKRFSFTWEQKAFFLSLVCGRGARRLKNPMQWPDRKFREPHLALLVGTD